VASISGIDQPLLVPLLQEAIVHNVFYDEAFTANQHDQAVRDISTTPG
jgi:hypothetical protein